MNEPAFPTSPNDHDPAWAAARTGGISVRDYFAAKAMQALLNHPNSANDWKNETIAEWAYQMADAMIRYPIEESAKEKTHQVQADLGEKPPWETD